MRGLCKGLLIHYKKMTIWQCATACISCLQGDSHTEAFRCIEMQENRAWGWGIDAFGVCSTIHCLLFGDYMQLEKTINAEGMFCALEKCL